MATTQEYLHTESRSIRAFTGLFFLIALLELLAIALTNLIPYAEIFTKPLIMLSIGGYYFYQMRTYKQTGIVSVFMYAAIFFSLCGDIFLWFKDELYFLLGLSSFLLAHICYIIVFSYSHTQQENRSQTIISRKPWLILFFAAYACLLIWSIYPSLGPMLIPVIVYSATIMIMTMAALNRWQRVSDSSFAWVFLGALLFVLSDSLIALGRFGQHLFSIPLLRYWIMGTYMCAQLFIVLGVLKQGNIRIMQKN